jgi:hypothetical protein
MKYVCLVYQDDKALEALPDAELDTNVRDCMAWIGELDASSRHVFSAGLESGRSATTLRTRNGRLSMTDGPFAETKELLHGFTIIEAKDYNAAIEIASKFPMGSTGTIELRPLMDPSRDLRDPLDRKVAASIRRASSSVQDDD